MQSWHSTFNKFLISFLLTLDNWIIVFVLHLTFNVKKKKSLELMNKKKKNNPQENDLRKPNMS